MKYVIANWKMNFSISDIDTWFHDYPRAEHNDVEVVIAPSTVHLPILRTVEKFFPFTISAQDVSVQDKGAHTGDIGAFQLKDFCKYCIVGHSERNENLDIIMRKRDICLNAKITPIVCFSDIQKAQTLYKKGVILAKENPQNISVDGKYRDEAPDQVKTDFTKIREQLPGEATVIYGGSVNRQNASNLFNISELDGVLVGNASLDPVHFADIVKSFSS